MKKIGFYNFTYYYVLQFLQKAYKNLKSPPVVLDVGCGVGSILLFLSEYSKQLVGLDVSERAIDIAKRASMATKSHNVLFKVGYLPELPSTFDLVIATEVIEHVPDDQMFLQKIFNALNNNGLLLLSTPLSENCFVNTKLYRNFDKEVGHLRRYSEKIILNLIESGGFEIVDYKKTESPLRNVLFLTKLGFVIRFIRGPFVSLFHLLDELFIKFLGASNIIILARKKHDDSTFLS